MRDPDVTCGRECRSFSPCASGGVGRSSLGRCVEACRVRCAVSLFTADHHREPWEWVRVEDVAIV